MLDELAAYHVDWSDLDKAHQNNSAFLAALASDKDALRRLVDGVRTDPLLWDMCEHNRLFDKLVLHDAPDRNFRIRLHVWSDMEVAAPHDHRWSFTTRLLTGGYDHMLYQVVEDTSQEGAAPAFEPRFRTTERAGDSYTIHHEVVHATTTQARTVSLLVRGPAEKSVSRRMDPHTGKLWFGLGRKDQTEADVARRRMTVEQFEVIRAQLADAGLV
ncbi:MULTISPECIES: hypothetical protein [Streptomyces]|uniref:Uncharacterized protein n=1 Tax=Streptomyces doudnae TaxID=3075536 RepID=A0ABD5ESQ9_9ACTN|nr:MULTISPECIES: hypothetical protein [unclassified Streptomyces]MDT0436432.1 hypothetical protein [Streptomyces sp. DSM 41981]MYQ65942.1 hypothetical protein [Streptomyces sp. SID4950]SCE10698.1 hypothetical protein GA0115242_121937 [Streptomyces sp. SolWspMP-5a-2]